MIIHTPRSFLSSFTCIGLFLLLLVMVYQLSPTAVDAHETDTYEVGTSTLNVRSSPGTDAEIIGSYSKGEVLHVEDIKFGWANVNYDGREGWVATPYLLKTESAQSAGKVTVDVDIANIRSGPSTSNDMIAQAKQGETLTKLDESGEWVKIQLNNGDTGWIAGWLVSTYKQEDDTIGEKPLEGINIVLDAGHGGFDPGAIAANGELEKDFTLPTAELTADALQRAGATVIMTRERDDYLTLDERIRISQAYFTHAFISVHYNSSYNAAANGVSTYYYEEAEGRDLASNIQSNLSSTTSLQNSGIHHGNLHVLRENVGSSVLVELGFISNPVELEVVQTPSYQQLAAKAITEGVIDHFSN
ncbi:hypothetical protein GCM10007216_14680 [Thalassobacillus devorans]|uniref:SH3b domain-containing protein n=1 Tax=Thalassobacillus devorans TaxID=279813 RepID=A0ABQ1NTQ0_9BACI|nr:N-acetylmuramoyl-L-alanine amidase [Thalassobacillus devorans]NIK28589.1 N-acetylmuramoyl-L-alanine amidase [Thalassobacillus devorans]GGC85047.1 hypothetical protein GCM10007216_14680 [Thalassobacillus devorans]